MPYENRINEALKHLGEEHRLGMIQTEEFRRRRRALFESWGEHEATTSPGSTSHRTTTQVNAPRSAGPDEPARSKAPILIVAAVALAVVAIVAAWLLNSMKAPDATAAKVPAAAPRSPELLNVMREATAFRNRNRWEAKDTEEFLAIWRSLSAADRMKAADEPSLRSLLYELELNIRAERQALAGSPDGAAQERLDRLTAFAEELSGSRQ